MKSENVRLLSEESEVPTGPKYAYHITHSDNIISILEDGIRPCETDNDVWEKVNTFVTEMSTELSGKPYPVDRNDVVYFFNCSSIPISWVKDKKDMVVFIVDLSGFKRDIYFAEMGPITSLIGEVESDNNLLRETRKVYKKGDIESGSQKGSVILSLERHYNSLDSVENPESNLQTDLYGVELFTPSCINSEFLNGIYDPSP